LSRPEDIAAEAAAARSIQAACRELAAVSGKLWHWGDGHGGYVLSVLGHELEAAGLRIEHTSTPKKKSVIPIAIKLRVVARDGCRCRHCGLDLMDGEITFDHVIAESKGGPTTVGNLVVSCRKCNCSKGAR
jgi:hypothetical protein